MGVFQRIGKQLKDLEPIAKGAIKLGGKGIEKTGDWIGKQMGDATESGIKKMLAAGKNSTKKVADFVSKDHSATATRIGKVLGEAAQVAENDIKAINNFAGWATGGKEFKGFNNFRNKMLNTNKYTGRKLGAILKDSDSTLTGKQFTKFGVGALLVGSAVMGTADGARNQLRRRQGQMTGVSGNAPTNNYAYQGASYADNAGATGDIVLNMHANRGSRMY